MGFKIKDFKCGKCSEEFESMVDAKDETYEDVMCLGCSSVGMSEPQISGTRIVSGVNLRAKVPHGFRDVISKVKAAHPHHKIQGDLS